MSPRLAQALRGMLDLLEDSSDLSRRLAIKDAREALASFEAAPPQAQLEKERAARQEAQSELARYKGLLASSRLDLMREMKEHGWTAPQQAQAPIDPDGAESRAGFRAFDEAQMARWATPWQVWREAVKWAAPQQGSKT